MVAWISSVWVFCFVTFWQCTEMILKLWNQSGDIGNVYVLTSNTYFFSGLWNKLWFPSPHGNGFLRMRKCSYATNSGRGSWACSWWPMYALAIPNAIAGNPRKNVKRLHRTILSKLMNKINILLEKSTFHWKNKDLDIFLQIHWMLQNHNKSIM